MNEYKIGFRTGTNKNKMVFSICNPLMQSSHLFSYPAYLRVIRIYNSVLRVPDRFTTYYKYLYIIVNAKYGT